MRPTWRSGAVALCAVIAGLVVAGVPSASADPIGDARARAAQLAQSIQQLQTQAEVATERYDKAESQLLQANAAQATADQQLNAIQASAAQAQQDVIDRTRDLYESGGDPAVIASMLSGDSPMDALDSYKVATAVINYAVRSADAAAQTVASAEALDVRDTKAATQVRQLQIAATTAAAKVTSLIAQQRQELANTNGTIRRLLSATQAAEALQGAKDFASAVTAAGGTVGTGEGTPPNRTVANAIAWAKQQLGKPYQWGGTGPDSYDCSGLTQQAYLHAGIVLPRVAADQYNSGPHPSIGALEPGDLLFWAYDASNPASIHHVTMYLGGGLMIAAPHTGTDIQIEPVYMSGFFGATRPWAS